MITLADNIEKISNMYSFEKEYVMLSLHEAFGYDEELKQTISGKGSYEPKIIERFKQMLSHYSVLENQEFIEINDDEADNCIKLFFDALYKEVIVHIPDLSHIKIANDGIFEIAKAVNADTDEIAKLIYNFFDTEVMQFHDLNHVAKFKKQLKIKYGKIDDIQFGYILNKTITLIINQKIKELQSNESKAI
jgi:hypothetical protein